MGRCAAHRLRKLHRSQRHSEHALRTGIQQSLRAGRGRGSGGQDIVHQKDALSLHSLRPGHPEGTRHIGQPLVKGKSLLPPVERARVSASVTTDTPTARARGCAIRSGTL